jgi:hypothetical protein
LNLGILGSVCHEGSLIVREGESASPGGGESPLLVDTKYVISSVYDDAMNPVSAPTSAVGSENASEPIIQEPHIKQLAEGLLNLSSDDKQSLITILMSEKGIK